MIPGDSILADADSAIDMGYISTVDAITRGTRDGLVLAVNVGAMLLVLIGLVALVNELISDISVFDAPMSLERGFGWFLRRLRGLGIPWSEAPAAGTLLGTKLVLNELMAYIQLVQQADSFSPGAQKILLYAICGFANLGSLGILIGAEVGVPERREEVQRLRRAH